MIKPTPIPSRPGFTLLEVMFSILILGTGLIAIASLFPVAGSVQRDTMDQVMAQNITTSAEAYLVGRGISAAALNTLSVPVAASVTDVSASVPGALPNIYSNVETLVSIKDRGFPSSKAASDSLAGNVYTCNADFYWYPLFLKEASGNIKVFVFVQRRIGTSALPFISNNSSTVNAGDALFDATGNVSFSALDDGSNGSGGWHCQVITGKSSYLSFSVIGGGVVR